MSAWTSGPSNPNPNPTTTTTTTTTTTSNLTRPRACVTCSRAKVKCEAASTGDICARCLRLNRPCEPLPPRARSIPKKRSPYLTSRISKYQSNSPEGDQINLLQPLNSTQITANLPSPPATHQNLQPQPISSSLAPDASVYGKQEPDVLTWDDRLQLGGGNIQRFALPEPPIPALTLPVIPKEPPIIDISLGLQDPDALLHSYRSKMSFFFPFISAPDHVNAETMRLQQPATYIAIMAIMTRVSSQQRAISSSLMKHLAEMTVVHGKRNIDLLTAILLYSAGCYHSFFNIQQFTILMSLASTLVTDLKLNRSLPQQDSRTLKIYLGYWYLNSIISSFFHRVEPLIWTPHLESCCHNLETSSNPDDIASVVLVRLQQICMKISQGLSHGRESSPNTVPPALYIHSLEEELKIVKQKYMSVVKNNLIVNLAYSHVEISLYKVGLSKSLALAELLDHDFARLEYLHACLKAVKSFFETYLAYPISRGHCMSIPIITHLTWALGVLQLLSTFEHPQWSLEWANSTIDFGEILGRLAEYYSQAKASLSLDPHTSVGEDILSHGARRFAWMKTYFETGNPSGQPISFEQVSSLPESQSYTGFATSFMDDTWMRDLLDLW